MEQAAAKTRGEFGSLHGTSEPALTLPMASGGRVSQNDVNSPAEASMQIQRGVAAIVKEALRERKSSFQSEDRTNNVVGERAVSAGSRTGVRVNARRLVVGRTSVTD